MKPVMSRFIGKDEAGTLQRLTLAVFRKSVTAVQLLGCRKKVRSFEAVLVEFIAIERLSVLNAITIVAEACGKKLLATYRHYYDARH